MTLDMVMTFLVTTVKAWFMKEIIGKLDSVKRMRRKAME